LNSYITEIHELDPRQIWVDLLDHKDVAPIFRSFWDHYVANSVKRRPVLGPNEYEEVQGLKSVVSVLGFWKALKSIADREVMEAKRLACREKAYYYTTWLQNGTQETGPLYAITQVMSLYAIMPSLLANVFSSGYRRTSPINTA
jgi:hypothetical protein